MIFYKRLYEDFNSLSVNPRVYKFSSHQPTDPKRIVGKMVMQNMYQSNN